MADSWEDIDSKQPKKAGGLNPAASSFNFNPAVASWSPGGAAPAAGRRQILCSPFILIQGHDYVALAERNWFVAHTCERKWPL